MADDEDSAAGARRKGTAGRVSLGPTLLGITKQLKNLRSPMDQASRWAEQTLKEKKLPIKPGLYTLTKEGRLSFLPPPASSGFSYLPFYTPDYIEDFPWILHLHNALLRVGFTRESKEYKAAELLEYLWNMSFHIEDGNPAGAASAAFMAGVLWSEKESRMARAVRRGGRSQAEEKSHNTQHNKWLDRSRELRQEGEKSQRARAEKIAAKENVKKDRVRRVLLKYEEKTGG